VRGTLGPPGIWGTRFSGRERELAVLEYVYASGWPELVGSLWAEAAS